MKNSMIYAAAIILTQISCTTPSINTKQRPPLKLEEVEQVALGLSQQEDLRKRLGPPTKIIPPSSSTSLEYWFYFEPPFHSTPRLTLGFEAQTGTLHSKSWDVREGDPERELSVATARFKNSKFQTIQPAWTNPHMAPDQTLFVDQNLGLTIVLRQPTKKVSGIEWSDQRPDPGLLGAASQK